MTRPRRFDDKVAIVTGAAGGIGLATALRLAEEGAILVLVDLHPQPLQDAMAAVLKAGASGASVVVCDVSSESQVEATVTEAISRHGRLDVVINNAGLMSFKPLEQFTGEDWNRILGVDLLGAFFFTKQAFLRMTAGGAIVNVSSIHAVRTTPHVAPYAAAKAALLSLSRSTAIEGQARGIRCNAVLPGAVETPMLRNNPEVKAGVEHIDRSELAQPAEIAAAIVYLASEDASFIQGASLVVDGGRLSQL